MVYKKKVISKAETNEQIDSETLILDWNEKIRNRVSFLERNREINNHCVIFYTAKELSSFS